MSKKQFTEFEKGKIIGFFEENISNIEIARRLQRSPQTISNVINKYKEKYIE